MKNNFLYFGYPCNIYEFGCPGTRIQVRVPTSLKIRFKSPTRLLSSSRGFMYLAGQEPDNSRELEYPITRGYRSNVVYTDSSVWKWTGRQTNNSAAAQ